MKAQSNSYPFKTVLLTGVLICFGAGCSMQYNGAFGGPDGGDNKSAMEYRKFKANLKKQRELAKRRETPAHFPGAAAQESHSAKRHMGDPATHPVSHQAAPLRDLGLYGQLSEQRSAAGSPLDSPDNIVQVTFVNEGADFDPDVDPTGTHLVFASTRHRATADLYIKRVDGTSVTQLTDDPANDIMPAFSPDGKWVAYASDRSGNWDIYLIPVDGNGQAQQITNSSAREIHPSFSNDGKKLVYCAFSAQSGQWEVVVVDLANPGVKQFIANGLFPSWSPTDNRIVFQRARERGSRWFSIWTVTYDGGEAKRPTEIAASSNAAVITPDWSPDGRHLVFCTVVDPQADEESASPAQADVWMIASDGTSRTNLTQSTQFVNLQPVWSPGGAIYFVSNRGSDGQENIWAIRPEMSLQQVVQQAPAQPAAEASVMAPTDH